MMQREQLKQLAQQLKLPVMSLNEFDTLSDEQLDWLSQQVARLCRREVEQLQQSFITRMPELFGNPEDDKK